MAFLEQVVDLVPHTLESILWKNRLQSDAGAENWSYLRICRHLVQVGNCFCDEDCLLAWPCLSTRRRRVMGRSRHFSFLLFFHLLGQDIALGRLVGPTGCWDWTKYHTLSSTRFTFSFKNMISPRTSSFPIRETTRFFRGVVSSQMSSSKTKETVACSSGVREWLEWLGEGSTGLLSVGEALVLVGVDGIVWTLICWDTAAASSVRSCVRYQVCRFFTVAHEAS